MGLMSNRADRIYISPRFVATYRAILPIAGTYRSKKRPIAHFSSWGFLVIFDQTKHVLGVAGPQVTPNFFSALTWAANMPRLVRQFCVTYRDTPIVAHPMYVMHESMHARKQCRHIHHTCASITMYTLAHMRHVRICA
jgi:hypothetical protein